MENIPKHKNNADIGLEDPEKLLNVIKDPIKLSECIAGVLSRTLSEHTLFAGRIVEAAIKRNLFQQFGRELNHLIRQGRVQKEFLCTHRAQSTLVELLKFIDDEVPDEDRFKAIKSIFFTAVSKDVEENDRILAYEFIKIGKIIGSGELLVLKAVYDIYSGQARTNIGFDESRMSDARYWVECVAKQVGHGISGLIDLHERQLVDQCLLSNRFGVGNLDVDRNRFRLTNAGVKFCEFIKKYETLEIS